jgi:hypothetical protein
LSLAALHHDPGISSVTVATVPALLAHLVDSATTDVDGGLSLADVIDDHRGHLAAWYGGLMGLLVIRASTASELSQSRTADGLAVAVVADTGVERLADAVAVLRQGGALVRRAEAAVAKRGEDPVPGLTRLLAAAERLDETDSDVVVHAEIPLTTGLHAALDVLAESSRPVGATFRVGGLAGELFPPPPVLAGIISACRDRGLRFSVSAGLERAFRHNDHETGFAHHGVLNVLAACLAASLGAAAGAVADRLATNDPVLLAQLTLDARDGPRPLWTAYTSSRVEDIVHDLTLHDVLTRDDRVEPAVNSRPSDNAVS